MRISNITALPTLPKPAQPVVSATSTQSTLPQDTLEISETARQKIDQLQQGNESLVQAVRQSRQSARNAALERVSHAKEYLKILARMSPSGDRGAASEAVRMAREIKSAAAGFKSGMANGEESNASIRAEIAAFAGVAGDTLKIARGLVESYLKKRKDEQQGDKGLEKEINNAAADLQEMVVRAMAPV